MKPDVRIELAAAGFDDQWLSGAEPSVATTAVVVGEALRRADLLRFVAADVSSNRDNLEFRCRDIRALRRELAQRQDFTDPGDTTGGWQSRQRRRRFALHIKHFVGWPTDVVQAHIDPVGTALPVWCWLVWPVGLFHVAWHVVDYQGYQDIDRIAAWLRSQ